MPGLVHIPKDKQPLMTKEEFVETLTILHVRAGSGDVIGYRCHSDIGNDDPRIWGSLLCEAFGRLCVDDVDDPVTHEGGTSHTPLYALDEIHTDRWPPGLFEKLSGYIWRIVTEDEINILDVIVARTGIKE